MTGMVKDARCALRIHSHEVIMTENKEQILRRVENAYQLIKDDNCLDACRSLEIAIDLMHMTGKTGKPL
jgi:hypothetical protein